MIKPWIEKARETIHVDNNGGKFHEFLVLFAREMTYSPRHSLLGKKEEEEREEASLTSFVSREHARA